MRAAQPTREEKIAWMAVWAARNKLMLVLEGECGFGRECVGISDGNNYADYHWHDKKTFDRLDNNGEVWTPEDAYHKHTCVAVLGRGEEAEDQLYRWLKWFDENNFKVELVERELQKGGGTATVLDLMVNGMVNVRMVRQTEEKSGG